MGGIVDKYIDAAELRYGGVDDMTAVIGLLNVTGDEYCFTPGFLNPGLRLFCVTVLFEICNEDVRSLAGEGDRNGAPDSAIAAGDDCFLAVQPSGASIGLFAV